MDAYAMECVGADGMRRNAKKISPLGLHLRTILSKSVLQLFMIIGALWRRRTPLREKEESSSNSEPRAVLEPKLSTIPLYY
eukprot:1550307-Rhodomonas_salina.1